MSITNMNIFQWNGEGIFYDFFNDFRKIYCTKTQDDLIHMMTWPLFKYFKCTFVKYKHVF